MGPIVRQSRQVRIAKFIDGMLNFEYVNTDLPIGAEQMFKEVITNAADNIPESLSAGVEPGDIVVNVTNNTVTIMNGGMVIPVEKRRSGEYAAEMIFGKLLTSSNYDDSKKRYGAGRNGYGVKLVNICSTYFRVTIGDPTHRKHYQQIWRDGMLIKEDPIINDYVGAPFVEVQYTLDFNHFGYTDDQYSPEAIDFFRCHCAYISFTCKTPIIFNNEIIDCREIKQFTTMLLGEDATDKMILHYTWEPGTILKKSKRGPQMAKDPRTLPLLELALLDTPDNATIVPFVNGLYTPEGGPHVENIVRLVSSFIVPMINEKTKKKKDDDNNKKGRTITLREVRPHVSIIVSIRWENPTFSSQSKYKLTSNIPSPFFI